MSDLLARGDHMDVGLSARVRSPCEGPVGEGDLQRTAVEKDRPWLEPHLLPLGDRISGHEADRGVGTGSVLSRLACPP